MLETDAAGRALFASHVFIGSHFLKAETSLL
jgi:hypothetical protein